MENPKPLLVTFADKNYIEQAKQLFAGAYFNAGYDKDMMIISPDITEEQIDWFNDKKILVKKLNNPVPKYQNEKFPETLYLIFQIFTEEFKKWSHIVYLDIDILIRYDFSSLFQEKSFGACGDVLNQKLKEQFNKSKVFLSPYSPSKHHQITKEQYNNSYVKLKKTYDLNTPMFNAGVFVLNTDIIEKNTFSNLLKLENDFGHISAAPPQGEINLLFYKKWNKLPQKYNVYPYYLKKFYKIKPRDIDGIFLHFASTLKPWDESSEFYGEWSSNLAKAEFINKKPTTKNILTKTLKTSLTQKTLAKIIYKFDLLLGLLGLAIKKISPQFYLKIKKLIKPNEKKYFRELDR